GAGVALELVEGELGAGAVEQELRRRLAPRQRVRLRLRAAHHLLPGAVAVRADLEQLERLLVGGRDRRPVDVRAQPERVARLERLAAHLESTVQNLEHPPFPRLAAPL